MSIVLSKNNIKKYNINSYIYHVIDMLDGKDSDELHLWPEITVLVKYDDICDLKHREKIFTYEDFNEIILDFYNKKIDSDNELNRYQEDIDEYYN